MNQLAGNFAIISFPPAPPDILPDILDRLRPWPCWSLNLVVSMAAMGEPSLFAALSWRGYGIFLLETVVALLVIGLAAWVLVRHLRPRTLARGGTSRIQIRERLMIEPKRTLYLIEVDDRTLLIGASEGTFQLITDLDSPPKGETA